MLASSLAELEIVVLTVEDGIHLLSTMHYGVDSSKQHATRALAEMHHDVYVAAAWNKYTLQTVWQHVAKLIGTPSVNNACQALLFEIQECLDMHMCSLGKSWCIKSQVTQSRVCMPLCYTHPDKYACSAACTLLQPNPPITCTTCTWGLSKVMRLYVHQQMTTSNGVCPSLSRHVCCGLLDP